tara:strand:+ start:317 stop:502 length:186 start_codon:yes stop_codon:yes gene_type:complete
MIEFVKVLTNGKNVITFESTREEGLEFWKVNEDGENHLMTYEGGQLYIDNLLNQGYWQEVE